MQIRISLEWHEECNKLHEMDQEILKKNIPVCLTLINLKYVDYLTHLTSSLNGHQSFFKLIIRKHFVKDKKISDCKFKLSQFVLFYWSWLKHNLLSIFRECTMIVCWICSIAKKICIKKYRKLYMHWMSPSIRYLLEWFEHEKAFFTPNLNNKNKYVRSTRSAVQLRRKIMK